MKIEHNFKLTSVDELDTPTSSSSNISGKECFLTGEGHRPVVGGVTLRTLLEDGAHVGHLPDEGGLELVVDDGQALPGCPPCHVEP